MSQHLKVLREAGIIRGEIDGPRSCYWLDRAALAAIAEAMGGFDRPAGAGRQLAEVGVMSGGRRRDRPAEGAGRNRPSRTLRNLWPYMWPADRPDLKQRVALALAVLVAAKIVTVLVPTPTNGRPTRWCTPAPRRAAPRSASPAVVTVPVMLVVAYGVGRILMNVFNNLRDALFAKVGQHAVRQLAYKTFVHMHELSLRYHLQRRTGGLSRIIERGVNGIETIVRFTILNTVPTIIEFLLAAVIITYQFDWIYLAVIAVTVWLYIWFTVKASDWRIKIRRAMNDSDTDANSKAIDSLLNFETVKYFGNEKMEARPLRPRRWSATRTRRSASGRRSPG